MKWYEKLQAAMFMIKEIPGILKAVEDAVPGHGKGEQKLELVRQLLMTAIAIADIGLDFFESVWPKIAELIAKIVDLFNKIGVFKKSQK